MKFKHGKNLIIKDKRSIYIDKTVVIGDNVTIYENNRIMGNSVIGDNVVIYPGCFLKDTTVGNNSNLDSVKSESAQVGNDCNIGPYARLRPNAEIKDGAKVGNFVEIKNAVIGEGSKVSHLAYVGDAVVGKDCNIGCGAIFVNYNGKEKNRSVVGDGVFIGSNVNVIAPVSISNGSYVCAGTTITVNTEVDDFVIGRVKETIKPGYSIKYRK